MNNFHQGEIEGDVGDCIRSTINLKGALVEPPAVNRSTYNVLNINRFTYTVSWTFGLTQGEPSRLAGKWLSAPTQHEGVPDSLLAGCRIP
jgi:hypothetical protein